MTAARLRTAGVGAAIALAATLACAVAASPPILSRSGHATAALSARLFFSPICHQQADRSFAIGGYPIAVCARCAGIYGGFAAGCWLIAGAALAGWRRAPRHPWLLAAFAGPCAIQWALPMAGVTGLAGSAGARALVGGLLGFGVAAFLLPAAGALVEEFRARPPRRARAWTDRRMNEAEG